MTGISFAILILEVESSSLIGFQDTEPFATRESILSIVVIAVHDPQLRNVTIERDYLHVPGYREKAEFIRQLLGHAHQQRVRTIITARISISAAASKVEPSRRPATSSRQSNHTTIERIVVVARNTHEKQDPAGDQAFRIVPDIVEEG